jgi:hypothetical protein
MNEETCIRKLAEKAGKEPRRNVNVAPRVMAKIREREIQYQAGLIPLAWMAGAGCILALVVGFFAVSELFAWNHPIMEILEVLTWGML